MSFTNSENLTSSFHVYILCITFSCMFVRANVLSNLLNRCSDSGDPHLVPDFSGKDLFSPSIHCLLLDSHKWLLSNSGKVFLCLFSSGFYHKQVLDIVYCFFCISLYSHGFCPCFYWRGALHVLICMCWIVLEILDKMYLAMMYDLFDDLLYSICHYLVKEFCIYIH